MASKEKNGFKGKPITKKRKPKTDKPKTDKPKKVAFKGKPLVVKKKTRKT